MSQITLLLERAQVGDPKVAEDLLPLVYDELRKLAAAKMAREAPGQTLQPTALVHEAWLRLSNNSQTEWRNRDQFYAMAAETMRRILVDRARRRHARKRGGELERAEFEELEIALPAEEDVVLQVHEALQQLEREDAEKAQVVKLRFFVGLEHAEIGGLLGVSEKTVQRHWAFAKAWLTRTMRNSR